MRSFGNHPHPFVGSILEIPAQQHDPHAEGHQFAQQRRIIRIGDDQHDDIQPPHHHQFESLQRQPYVYPSLLAFSEQVAQGQVMRMYALGHQDIVENAVIVQLVAALSRIRSVQAPPEIVRFGNLTLQRFDPFLLGDAMLDKTVQSSQRKAPFHVMNIIVIIRCVQQKIPVVKNADPTGFKR